MAPSQPGTWDTIETRRYVWDGYNIAAEIVIDEVTPSTNVTYYTWGLDLSGTLQGAGGVGGLLAETKMTASTTNTYYAFCDANGNVTEYADAAGTVRGHYEYSPFGEITAQSGDMADNFTHRFSTKPFDVTTGKVHYEFRPNDPLLGRWLTRDPIEEAGGLILYGVVGNNLINRTDVLGLLEIEVSPIIYLNMAFPWPKAGDYTANASLQCSCSPENVNMKEIRCKLIVNPVIRIDPDPKKRDYAINEASPGMTPRQHEENHHRVFLTVYVDYYKRLLRLYELTRCCNCQTRLNQLKANYTLLESRLNMWEEMKEYGARDEKGRLVVAPTGQPWVAYGSEPIHDFDSLMFEPPRCK